MTIPYSQNLHSQSFSSKFYEFVWQFPNKNQIILRVNRDGTVHLEEGVIDNEGNYTLDFFEQSKLNYGTKDIPIKDLKKLHSDVMKSFLE